MTTNPNYPQRCDFAVAGGRCDKPVEFYAFTDRRPFRWALPNNQPIAIGGFCSREHVESEPRPTRKLAREHTDGTPLWRALLRVFPRPLPVADAPPALRGTNFAGLRHALLSNGGELRLANETDTPAPNPTPTPRRQREPRKANTPAPGQDAAPVHEAWRNDQGHIREFVIYGRQLQPGDLLAYSVLGDDGCAHDHGLPVSRVSVRKNGRVRAYVTYVDGTTGRKTYDPNELIIILGRPEASTPSEL